MFADFKVYLETLYYSIKNSGIPLPEAFDFENGEYAEVFHQSLAFEDIIYFFKVLSKDFTFSEKLRGTLFYDTLDSNFRSYIQSLACKDSMSAFESFLDLEGWEAIEDSEEFKKFLAEESGEGLEEDVELDESLDLFDEEEVKEEENGVSEDIYEEEPVDLDNWENMLSSSVKVEKEGIGQEDRVIQDAGVDLDSDEIVPWELPSKAVETEFVEDGFDLDSEDEVFFNSIIAKSEESADCAEGIDLDSEDIEPLKLGGMKNEESEFEFETEDHFIEADEEFEVETEGNFESDDGFEIEEHFIEDDEELEEEPAETDEGFEIEEHFIEDDSEELEESEDAGFEVEEEHFVSDDDEVEVPVQLASHEGIEVEESKGDIGDLLQEAVGALTFGSKKLLRNLKNSFKG